MLNASAAVLSTTQQLPYVVLLIFICSIAIIIVVYLFYDYYLLCIFVNVAVFLLGLFMIPQAYSRVLYVLTQVEES